MQFGPTPWLSSLRPPWHGLVFPSPCQPLLHGAFHTSKTRFWTLLLDLGSIIYDCNCELDNG